MTAALRVTAVVFVAAVLQVSAFSGIDVAGAAPDLLLVTVVALALLRGAITGAAAGFAGGLLVDVATLGTLGVTSLLLTLAGFWAGRYGETTGRGRLAPWLAVGVMTVLYGLAAFALYWILDESVSAYEALVVALPPTLLANLLLAGAVVPLVHRVVGPARPAQRAPEVEAVAP